SSRLQDAWPTRRSSDLRLAHLWADGGDQGGLADWAKGHWGWTVEIVKKPPRWFWVLPGQEPPEIPTGFQVLKWRWIVERTFAWRSEEHTSELQSPYDLV